MNLNDRMEFDHVIEVLADGTVIDRWDLYGPEMRGGELEGHGGGWNLMTGYTGQYMYHGPSMHPSEYIGGQMERDILGTPGVYVALVDYPEDPDDEEPDGWGVAYIHTEEDT